MIERKSNKSTFLASRKRNSLQPVIGSFIQYDCSLIPFLMNTNNSFARRSATRSAEMPVFVASPPPHFHYPCTCCVSFTWCHSKRTGVETSLQGRQPLRPQRKQSQGLSSIRRVRTKSAARRRFKRGRPYKSFLLTPNGKL